METNEILSVSPAADIFGTPEDLLGRSLLGDSLHGRQHDADGDPSDVCPADVWRDERQVSRRLVSNAAKLRALPLNLFVDLDFQSDLFERILSEIERASFAVLGYMIFGPAVKSNVLLSLPASVFVAVVPFLVGSHLLDRVRESFFLRIALISLLIFGLLGSALAIFLDDNYDEKLITACVWKTSS
eukprot:g33615.t1